MERNSTLRDVILATADSSPNRKPSNTDVEEFTPQVFNLDL